MVYSVSTNKRNDSNYTHSGQFGSVCLGFSPTLQGHIEQGAEQRDELIELPAVFKSFGCGLFKSDPNLAEQGLLFERC